jgi:hypothetical protein
LISAFASRADGALARAARRRAMRARRATAPTTALTTALALASLASRAVASSARFGRERLVMQTTLGDVTLALYDHESLLSRGRGIRGADRGLRGGATRGDERAAARARDEDGARRIRRVGETHAREAVDGEVERSGQRDEQL